MSAKTYVIEIPITTDCDPSVLLDLATEMSGQVAEEATDYGTGDVDATVDEDEISVRPAGHCESPVCLYPNCNNTSRSRGLCHNHYQTARTMIRNGQITEESLFARGFMAPKGTANGVINGSALFLDESARGDGFAS